jgi:hypothetical protein
LRLPRSLACAEGGDQGVLGRIVASALGITAISRDAIGKVEPRFGDEQKTRFVGKHRRPFCQIKARGRQSPVLEFQTHVRTQSTYSRRWVFETLGKSQIAFGKT